MTQSWGGAHLAGVAHNVATPSPRLPASRGRSSAVLYAIEHVDTWGYGVIGGVTFNLPMLSAGTKIAFQGAYAHGAIAYSGATSPAWGEQDQGFNTNGNGAGSRWPTAIFDPAGNTTSRTPGRLAAQLTWKVSPNFEIDPEVAYASVEYGSGTAADWLVSPKAPGVVGRRGVRLVAGQEPRFRARRGLRVVASGDAGRLERGLWTGTPGAFKNDSDGFNGRLHIVRSF